MLKIISMLKLASNCRLYYKLAIEHLLIQINIDFLNFNEMRDDFFDF